MAPFYVTIGHLSSVDIDKCVPSMRNASTIRLIEAKNDTANIYQLQQVIDQIIGFRAYLISFVSKYCYDRLVVGLHDSIQYRHECFPRSIHYSKTSRERTWTTITSL